MNELEKPNYETGKKLATRFHENGPIYRLGVEQSELPNDTNTIVD